MWSTLWRCACLPSARRPQTPPGPPRSCSSPRRTRAPNCPTRPPQSPSCCRAVCGTGRTLQPFPPGTLEPVCISTKKRCIMETIVAEEQKQ